MLHPAARSDERVFGCRAHQAGSISVSHNQTAALRASLAIVGECRINIWPHRPIKAITPGQIVQPFTVAQEIRARYLDLNNADHAFAIDRQHVCAAAVWQRNLAQHHLTLRMKQPRNAARDIRGGAGRRGKCNTRRHWWRVTTVENKARPRCGEPHRGLARIMSQSAIKNVIAQSRHTRAIPAR